MIYMKASDWVFVFISLLFAVMLGISLSVFMTELKMLAPDQADTILFSSLTMVLSYTAGSAIFSDVVREIRARRIKAEVKAERAMRKLQGHE